MAAHSHLLLLGRLTAWDSGWYISLAEFGYHGTPGTAGNPLAPLAFFPLYPAYTALLSVIPGVSTVAAGFIVSLLSGSAAVCALVRIGRLHSPRTGLILVALWAGAPMAIVLSMPYTEAMFTALAAWALVGVLERNWWLAGACCMFAGLTRSTATVLIAVVVVAAGIAVYRGGRERWPALACALAAPLGLLGYWAAVAARAGSLTGWWDIERRGWRSRFDFGVEAFHYIVAKLSSDESMWQTAVVLLVLGAVALAVLTVTNRLPWPLAAYAIGVVVLAIGTAGLPWGKVRFLVPGFTLLIPVAIGLAGCKRSTIVASVAAWVLLGSWFSAFSVTVWTHTI
jgi:hypothetical protein